jgi:redox-sensitive bicupin YhaK (pirin superfamily)
MTAGSGILHIEAPPEWLVAKGGLFHGIQLWVNLPRDAKLNDPRYQDLRSGEVALATTPDAGALVRVIAGSVDGVVGPGSTHTPMTLVHATVEPGARLELTWPVDFNALVYVLSGQGTVGHDGHPIRLGQAAVLGAGDYVTVAGAERQESRTPALDVIVVGGRPIRETVAWAGPFVMNTRAEIMQAYADFQRGRFGHIPADGR